MNDEETSILEDCVEIMRLANEITKHKKSVKELEELFEDLDYHRDNSRYWGKI